MPVEVETPDGIVEFPETMEPAQIEKALGIHYGKIPGEKPELTLPEGVEPGKPGERSVYEEPTWFDQPTVNLGDLLIKGPGEGKSATEEGITAALRPAINSLTTPRNLTYMLGSMGIASTGPAAKALVSAIWTGAMGANAIENAPQLYSKLGEEMAKPPEERDRKLLGELGTQAFIDTGMFLAPAIHTGGEIGERLGDRPTLDLKPFLDQARQEIQPEVTDASKIGETEKVYGAMRPQPEQGVRQVPVEESGAGVQLQGPPKEGEVPLTVTETTPVVPPEEMPETPSKTGLYPAIREVGGKVDVAPAGETHPDIIKKEGLKAEDIDQRGFVNEKGEFKDREQAAQIGGVPTEREAARQHSTDLPEAAGPGSPSITQPPDPKAQIEQLEESFRNIKGEKPSLQEQVKQAFNLGEKLSGAKDAVSTAVQGLKSGGDYLIKKWQGTPKIDEMLREKGELSAALEKRGWRVREFVKSVEKAMPRKSERAAILKWVDAGGDLSELKRGEAETLPKYKQAYKDAQNLKGDALVAAQNIRNFFESRLQEAIDSGVLENGVEDYIHRLYERDPKTRNKALAYVQSGLLKQNPGLVKKRIFKFDWEAEKLGMKPVQDFLPRIAQYEASLSRAIAARKFVQSLVGPDKMKASDGRPVLDVAGLGVPIEDPSGVREATLIKPSFKPGDESDPKNNRRDYVERDYPALRKWRWATTDAGGKPIFVQGNLLVHPDMVGRIDALLEPSRVKYGRYPRLGKAALGLSSTVKQTMLDLSGFHQVQIAVHGMEHKVMPWRITDKIDFENPNVDGLLKGGLTLGGEYYSSHHGEGLVGSALTRHIPILGPLMESYHNWLFQSFIPRIKTTMALNALERNRARYKGKLTEEQIFNKTASESNSAFGELNYIMLERSQTTRDIARLIMLAPDFLEARGRFAAGALEKGGKLGGHEQRAALLLGAITMYATARIINKITDDKYHFEPENAFSIVHNGHAYSLRTVQGDIMHLIESPLSFWLHRLNPVFGRTALELATQRDEFGRKRTVPEVLWDSVKNTIPISLRTSRERSLWESMMNGMGVTARRWNDVDKAFTLAKDWKAKHGVIERGEFIYDPNKDPLRGLKIALSRSDDGGAAKEIKKLLDSKVYTREKLNKYFDRYASMPFTGSKKNDTQFLKTLTEDQRKIVEGARQHKLALRNLYRQARSKYDESELRVR